MQGRVTKRVPANRGITKEDEIAHKIQTGKRDKLADGTPIKEAREKHLEIQDKFEAKLAKSTEKQSAEVAETKETPKTESPIEAKVESLKETPKKK